MSKIQYKERKLISKVIYYPFIFWWIRIIVPSIHRPPKTQNVFRSVLTILIGALRDNSTHRKVMESLLGIIVVGSCPSISNRCTLILVNQKARIYASATELDIIRFEPLAFRELMWHISTKVNDGLLAAYITVFVLRKGKRRWFITFLVYALVYMSIDVNLVTLATLSPWYDSVWTHICSPLSRSLLLIWYRTVKTRLLIDYYI